ENEVRAQLAYGCDWLPTIAELCGAKLPGVTLDGKSLCGVIKQANAPSLHNALHWQIGNSWAVREGDWKLLFDVNDTTEQSPGTVIPGAFLTNLKDDPSEKRNLATDRPDLVARLQGMRARWEAELARDQARLD